MQATLFGATPPCSVIAVIGQFDPFTHLHADLMCQLGAEGRRQGRTPVAIMFEPDVRAVLHGPERWLACDDAAIKRRLIGAAGVESVLQVACDQSDLESGAREVFDLVCQMVPLADLWLGHRQRLGSGNPGSVETTQHEARRHGVRITRLPPVEILPHMNDVRMLLGQGQVAAAARLLGRQPQRVRTSLLEVAWAPGLYTVLGHYDDDRTTPFKLLFEPSPGGMSVAPWPDPACGRITFITGPGDAMGEAMAAD